MIATLAFAATFICVTFALLIWVGATTWRILEDEQEPEDRFLVDERGTLHDLALRAEERPTSKMIRDQLRRRERSLRTRSFAYEPGTPTSQVPKAWLQDLHERRN